MAWQAVDQACSSLAVACQGSELSLWSLTSQKCTYRGRAPKPDKLGLTERPWNTAVAFLPLWGSLCVLVGTNTGRVRLYDTVQKRPIFSLPVLETRVTALVVEADGEIM